HRHALQLVAGQVLRSALDLLVARAAEEPGDRHALGQVLVVVPAVELVFLLGGDVRPDHQESRALRGHGVPSSAARVYHGAWAAPGGGWSPPASRSVRPQRTATAARVSSTTRHHTAGWELPSASGTTPINPVPRATGLAATSTAGEGHVAIAASAAPCAPMFT